MHPKHDSADAHQQGQGRRDCQDVSAFRQSLARTCHEPAQSAQPICGSSAMSALRLSMQRPERLSWVGSGSSVWALERPLPRINLTCGPFVPQQPMPMPAPQRAILVADVGRNRCRDRIGNGSGCGSESLALSVRNTQPTSRWRLAERLPLERSPAAPTRPPLSTPSRASSLRCPGRLVAAFLGSSGH